MLNLAMSPLHPGYTPKIETKDMYFVGTVAAGLHSIFVNRGGSEEERNKIVKTIMDRQKEIEDSGIKFNPICIFAEGTTTGGNHLLKFKRGAF